MAVVLQFPRHARTSAGYRSGRSSDLETPETRSTAKTRSGGTSSHCDTACTEMPRPRASLAKPPAAAIARSRASFAMTPRSSTASFESQVSLHCFAKEPLYHVDMTLGNRIRLARERIPLTQEDVGRACGVSKQAVYQWEIDKTIPKSDVCPALRKVLRVTFAYLHAGEGDPPPVDDPVVRAEDLQMEVYEKRRLIEANKPPAMKQKRKHR